MKKRIWQLVAAAGLILGFLTARSHPGGLTPGEPLGAGITDPTQLSWKDWKRVLGDVKNALGSKNLPILAAGVAYFSTLAFFPLMAAGVAIAALVITPAQLQTLIGAVETYLPGDVASLVATQLQSLAGRRADNIIAATVAIAVSLFSASGASKNLVTATNIAYGVGESRSWLKQQLNGLGWTVSGLFFGFTVAALLVVNERILRGIGVFPPFITGLLYGRWFIILFIITLALAIFYRYGPNRTNPHWHLVSWGAVIATVVWLAATALFFVYVHDFGHYARSYSLFAGIIILMLWFNLSAFAVLLGAVVNHRLETAARVE